MSRDNMNEIYIVLIFVMWGLMYFTWGLADKVIEACT